MALVVAHLLIYRLRAVIRGLVDVFHAEATARFEVSLVTRMQTENK